MSSHVTAGAPFNIHQTGSPDQNNTPTHNAYQVIEYPMSRVLDCIYSLLFDQLSAMPCLAVRYLPCYSYIVIILNEKQDGIFHGFDANADCLGRSVEVALRFFTYCFHFFFSLRIHLSPLKRRSGPIQSFPAPSHPLASDKGKSLASYYKQPHRQGLRIISQDSVARPAFAQ